MSEKARQDLLEIRQETHEKINKNRKEKVFKENDIVFILKTDTSYQVIPDPYKQNFTEVYIWSLNPTLQHVL